MRRLFVLLVLPSLLLAPPGARGEIIERVVAKVNGQIITLSEFQSRQIAAAQGARVDPATVATFLRQNNAKILQDAIDEILIMQKAEDAGMKAPSQWIDEAIAGIRKENNITTDEQMQDALDREGITLAELRHEPRARDHPPLGDGARDPAEDRGDRVRAPGRVREAEADRVHQGPDGDPAGDPGEGGRGRARPRPPDRGEGEGRRGLRRPRRRPTPRRPAARTAERSDSSPRAT